MQWQQYPGRFVNDPYIGLIYLFDEPQVLVPGCDKSRYVVIEYLPGGEPENPALT